MNNKKCAYCGFINFMTAEVCRKCEAILTTSPEAEQHPGYYGQPAARYAPGSIMPYQAPKNSFPVLKVSAYVFVGVVVLAALSGGGMAFLKSHSKVTWREYHPEGETMTVMMPNEPTRHEPVTTPLPTGSMTNHSYVSVVTGQGTAMFCFVDYTGTEFTDDITAQGLDAELNDFLRRTNSTLISKKSINYQGVAGVEFEIKPPDSLGPRMNRGFGKLLLDRSRLYFFSIVANEESNMFSERDKFLNPTLPAVPNIHVFREKIPAPNSF
jgi:hypothetical protein